MAWPAAIPYIIMAVSAAAQVYAQEDARKKQNQQIDLEAENQRGWKKKQKKMMSQSLQDLYGGDNRLNAYQAAQSDEEKNLLAAAQQAQVERKQMAAKGTQGNLSDVGLSSAYSKQSTTANQKSNENTAKFAQLMSGLSAVDRLYANEGNRLAAMNNDLILLGNFAHGDKILGNRRIKQAGRVDPWLQYGGRLGQDLAGSKISQKPTTK